MNDGVFPTYSNCGAHISNLLVDSSTCFKEAKLEQVDNYFIFRLFGQLATFFLYFATVFWCFLLRPTPFERHMNSTDLYCLAEVHKVNLSGLNTRTHVSENLSRKLITF